jgi:hypothetical protein
MTDKREERGGDESDKNADEGVISDRIQELTWALLDEQINDDEFNLLDTLLLSDEKARETYLGCTQLHADLMAHFAGPTEATRSQTPTALPVLGFLTGDSSLGLQSSGEEAMQ